VSEHRQEFVLGTVRRFGPPAFRVRPIAFGALGSQCTLELHLDSTALAVFPLERDRVSLELRSDHAETRSNTLGHRFDRAVASANTAKGGGSGSACEGIERVTAQQVNRTLLQELVPPRLDLKRHVGIAGASENVDYLAVRTHEWAAAQHSMNGPADHLIEHPLTLTGDLYDRAGSARGIADDEQTGIHRAVRASAQCAKSRRDSIAMLACREDDCTAAERQTVFEVRGDPIGGVGMLLEETDDVTGGIDAGGAHRRILI
jgi:hypothetical protein